MLYMILKKARRFEGEMGPLLISFQILRAKVLRIAAFNEWALKEETV